MSKLPTKKKEAAPEAAAAHALTFQRHPLFQIQDEDPSCYDRLEIVLRPDGVRIATYCNGDARAQRLSVNVSWADFGAFAEYGRAHGFETASENSQNSPPPDPPSFLESWLLQITSDPFDSLNYVEICLRPNGASFTVTASDREGGLHEQMVRISAVDFKALIDGVERHKLDLSR